MKPDRETVRVTRKRRALAVWTARRTQYTSELLRDGCYSGVSVHNDLTAEIVEALNAWEARKR